MTINDAMNALVNDLAAGDVPDPLAQRFTLANVWYDLCRLSGEPVPALVAALVEGDTAAPSAGLDPAFVARLLAADPREFAAIRGEEAHRGYVAD
jgi:hypothetical protein